MKTVWPVRDTASQWSLLSLYLSWATVGTKVPKFSIRVEGVKKLLSELKPFTASGPHKVPTYLLKEGADELAPALSNGVYSSRKSELFPSAKRRLPNPSPKSSPFSKLQVPPSQRHKKIHLSLFFFNDVVCCVVCVSQEQMPAWTHGVSEGGVPPTWIEPMVAINSQPWGIVYWLVFKCLPVQTTYLFLQAFLKYFYSQEMLLTSEIKFKLHLILTLSVELQTIMTFYEENYGQNELNL